MFTQPAPPSPGLITPGTTTSSPPTSSSTHTATSRSSRLRGLSYLRTYTQNHILSRDTSSPTSATASSPAVRSPTVSGTASAAASSASRRRPARPVEAVSSADSAPAVVQSSQPLSSSLPPSDRVPPDASSADPSLAESSSNQSLRGNQNPADKDGPEAEGLRTTRSRSATMGDVPAEVLPTIRFSAHYDPRSNRQSLSFTPVSRTLPTGKEVIKVGRYSERENHAPVPANAPSSAPVGFKSKVVSRRHCEFWYENGKWFIRDVKSSSGTFLNHIRLSPPGTESKPYSINDGDIVQLGIDFRGGEEMIFRCVKMRIELNRGWQAKPNTFNMATHKRLRNLTSASSTASHAQDCSICLNAIAVSTVPFRPLLPTPYHLAICAQVAVPCRVTKSLWVQANHAPKVLGNAGSFLWPAVIPMGWHGHLIKWPNLDEPWMLTMSISSPANHSLWHLAAIPGTSNAFASY